MYSFLTAPNSAELPEAKLATRIKSVLSGWMTFRSKAAGWERDQFGTSTSAGLEKSKPGHFSIEEKRRL